MTVTEPSRDMIALYEEVARLTGHMLSAAHQADWDRLIELEAGCARCIESIKGCPVPALLTEEARQQKVELLRRILSDDREIRKLTAPWMEHVGKLLGTANTQCQVARAYRDE